MIKKTELRVGNFIIDQDGDFTQIDSGEYIDLFYEEFEPIQLTPERLKKIGFETIGDTTLYRLFIEGGQFLYQDEQLTLCGANIKNSELNINCKYVHTFQNIYFALLAKEIEINL